MSRRLDQEREATLQPKRMESCETKLKELGYVVMSNGLDKLEFVHNGHTIQLWPYSGWYSGKGIKDGRGFNKLLEQLNEE